VVAVVSPIAVPTAAMSAPARSRSSVLVGVSARGKNAAEATITAAGGSVKGYYAPGRFFVVTPPTSGPAWSKSIAGSSGVRYAEPDQTVRPDGVPNDPGYVQQWAFPVIGAPQAWDIPSVRSDVVVGVVDSGIEYTHEDLASQMWTNPGEIPGDGIDNDADGWVDDVHGVDCVNHDGDPVDDYFHGTHVAGTIAAAADNGIGIAGTTRGVRLMALKFIGANGVGTISDLVQCLDYATQHGVQVTNNSYSFPAYSQALADAVGRANTAGQVFVASSGNNGSDIDSVLPRYPAGLEAPNVLTVAATDQNDGLADFSDFGRLGVDLAAPGVDIYSTDLGNSYSTFSGTSMAANFVSGAAAQIFAAVPGVSAASVIDRLVGSTRRLPSLEGAVATGRLDMAAAMENDPVAPGGVSPVVTQSTRTSLTVTWSAPGDDGAGGGRVSSYAVSYSPAGQGAWSTAPAPRPGDPGATETATIGGLRPGTSYDVSVVAVDNVGNRTAGSSRGSTTPGDVRFEDAATSAAGWGVDSPWTLSPTNPHSGAFAWSDSAVGPSANGLIASIRTPSFSLADAVNPTLTFWQRYRLQTAHDFGFVDVSVDHGATWTNLTRFNGADDYRPATLDLSAYAGNADVRLRFRLTTDVGTTFDGWDLDDLVVSSDDVTAPAAPTGLAGRSVAGQAQLDWNDSPEPDLVGYGVYRTTDAPSAPSRTWQQLGSTTTSAWTDAAVTTGATYYYRVDAADTSGNRSAPSSEVTVTPSSQRSWAPTTVTVSTGTSAGDPVGNLADDDDAYFRVASSRGKSATAPVSADWTMIATVTRASASGLTLTFTGGYTGTVTGSMYAWRFRPKGTWEQVGTFSTAGSETTVTWTTSNLDTYLSATGEVRMRIQASGTGTFTANADLARFTLSS
jgi:subtilisin family serine protease